MPNVIDYGAQFNNSNYQTLGNPYLKLQKLFNTYTISFKSVGI